MMKMISIIMLLALLCASCSKSGGGSGSSDTSKETVIDNTPATDTSDSSDNNTTNDNVTDDTPPDDPVEDVRTLPDGAYDFETNVKFVNATSTQESKLRKALEIIKLVVATDEFRSKILNHTYGGKKTFYDNGGYTNAEVYQKILDGAESLQPTKDNEMDLEVEMYTATTSTVGYTYPDSKRIWVNTKFFNQYTAAGVAHNLMHEWLHKLGFKHASSYSTSRDYSVPYAIGDLVGEIGKDFL
jgi:hypothetical protein